jgi:Mlc titration factor MtfA (ptsG expression regulator)
VERHRKSDIDKYGATNPAEFFAVVTEAYFERPKRLQKKHPELYEQLREFYEQL